jgi:phasin
MTQAYNSAAGSKTAGAPRMEVPQAFREMADKGAAQAKESFEKMRVATTEASTVLQDACSTAARGAMSCNAKVIEFARSNSESAFDFANKLLGVKSPAEFLELSTEHARRQFEVLSEQAKELTALSQKVMLESAEPLKAGAANVFRGPVA